MSEKRINAPDPCPCGSGLAYPACCGPFIVGTDLPQTAQQLMRSRYTAYTRGDAAYLSATWHPTTRRQDLDADPRVRWLGLKIIATEAGEAEDHRGLVEFVARYKIGGRAHRLHERSRFKRFQGRWFYVDAELTTEP